MRLSSTSIRRPVLAIVLNLALVLFGLIALNLPGRARVSGRRSAHRHGATPPTPAPTPTSSSRRSPSRWRSPSTASPASGRSPPPAATAAAPSPSSSSSASISRPPPTTCATRFRARCATCRRTPNPPIVEGRRRRHPHRLPDGAERDPRATWSCRPSPTTWSRSACRPSPASSEVRIWGEKRYAMRLWLDPMRMAGPRRHRPGREGGARPRRTWSCPRGSVEGASTELTVRTLGRLLDRGGLQSPHHPQRSGRPAVRLGDVGNAELGAGERSAPS